MEPGWFYDGEERECFQRAMRTQEEILHRQWQTHGFIRRGARAELTTDAAYVSLRPLLSFHKINVLSFAPSKGRLFACRP